MKSLSIFIVSCCLILTGCSEQIERVERPTTHIIQGFADFNKIHLSRTTLLYPLEGEWRFAPEQLIEPSQPWPEEESDFLAVPLSWERVDPALGLQKGHGKGSYRLLLRLNEEDVGQTLGLYVKPISSAYRLWVDGHLLREIGKVSTSPADTIPRETTEYIYFVPVHNEIQIDIQVANYNQRKGGIWGGIYIGSEKAIEASLIPQLVRDSVNAGALFMMGIFYFAFAWLYIPQRSTFFLGLLSISLGLRTFFLGETLVTSFLPGLLWEWQVKLEYGIEIAAALAFNHYFRAMYPEHFSRYVLKVIQLVYAGLTMLVLFTPALVFTEWLSVFAGFAAITLLHALLFVYPKAMQYKRLGARSGGAALLIAFLAVLNDSFYYLWFPISSTELIYSGFFIFLLTQMAVTIRRYILLNQEAAALTIRLAESNEKLEQKIALRTRQLTDAHRANSRLMHNVAHDLNAPITLISRQAQQLKAYVNNEGQMFLGIIEQQSEWAVQLVQNLNDLASLQENEMSFHPIATRAEEILRFLYKRTEPIIRSGGFRWSSKPLDDLFEAEPLIIYVDLFLIERVFDNLVSNVLKYALKGRDVHMTYRKHVSHLEIVFENEIEPFFVETPERMFERFYQQKEDEAGSGIGLAVCREIVRLHEGLINVVQPDKGRIQIIVTLPAKE
jgi:signal transduction histidine kinase